MKGADYAIECEGLTKKFGEFKAVDSINLKIKKGELFGFLGPNGAGKTTTIKMLTTLLTPNAGEAKVAGFDLKGEPEFVRSRIGVVPQEFALFGELTATENLWYIGKLFGMSDAGLKKRGEELLKIVGLYEHRNLPSEGYSGGMKQRLSVAAGLLHTPEIVFMDEPTTGLDPQSRIALRELTKKLNESGITIVYTTHDMEEADKLCERIAIMDKGKIIAEGTPEELKHKYGGMHKIELELGRHEGKVLSELKELVGAKEMKMDGKVIELSVPSVHGDVLHRTSNFFARKRVEVKEMRTREPSLEDVFINLTKKDARG
ncbi:hypothetical protein AUJ17_00760 [Candidatus Micrarchaeota archaeon CG1_02_47_40]|nr:MAG: hypothetical protein AUJ17_00760 [Candidatus Micrarchaeota archaeon CG1_02_47_40]